MTSESRCRTDARTPDAYLPLRPVEFQALVSLSRGERHGYAILQDAEERGEGAAVPGLATLYRALKRLADEGLIEEAEARDPDPQDERRRYFRLTDLGRRVAEAEARRLATLVQVAQENALL